MRYDGDGGAIGYAFLNARRFGVRLDDLDDRDELRALFLRTAGFAERDWGHAIPTKAIRRRTGIAG